MELRITKDAQTAISQRLEITESKLTEVPFFEVWGVHVFSHSQGNFFLLTEGVSYFSIISPIVSSFTPRSFESYFRTLISNEISSLVEGPLPPFLQVGELEYAKTKNDGLRRVQTDQIWRAQRLLDEGRNTFLINRIPYKSIGFKFPVDIFIQGVTDLLKSNGDIRVFVPNDVRVN